MNDGNMLVVDITFHSRKSMNTRIQNVLRCNGIISLFQLIKTPARKLYLSRNVGRYTIICIKETLDSFCTEWDTEGVI